LTKQVSALFATPHHTELKQTVLAINYVVLCCYVTRLMDDQIRIKLFEAII